MNNPNQYNELKGKKGFTRIIKAGGYSLDGLRAAYRSEAAFRQLVCLHGVLLLLLCWVEFETAIKMLLLSVSVLSLIVELLNTGLEAVVDDISLEIRQLAKCAKDVGSAAQMLILILLAILWCWAFWAA